MVEAPASENDTDGSLLSPSAMGGLIAGGGFEFQARYAVCHLPKWLDDPGFHQLFHEGAGDIDVRFQENGGSRRVYVQAKDHDVTPAEFKEVIGAFRAKDAAQPGLYQTFTLACPSLSPQLRSIESGLARLRNAKPFYDDEPDALDGETTTLDTRMRKLGLNDDEIKFVSDKVTIETKLGYLSDDEKSLAIFIAAILKHPHYAKKIRAMVEPAYVPVLHAISSNKGRVLERAALESILRASVATELSPEKALTVWIQNWTKETFEPPADFELDWSARFDRDSRKVPPSEVWNAELVPQLGVLRGRIIDAGAARTIRFRGRCALSTGIALGASFPTVGGWTFEVLQPPAKEPWRSDAPVAPNYDLQSELVEGLKDGSDLIVGLNIRGDGRQDVERYIESAGISPNAYLFMSPPTQGAQSIGGAGEACAMALAVQNRLGQVLKQRQLRMTRLFFYGPLALSVFLGQRLTAIGHVQLYEYQDPSYVPSCLLRT